MSAWLAWVAFSYQQFTFCAIIAVLFNKHVHQATVKKCLHSSSMFTDFDARISIFYFLLCKVHIAYSYITRKQQCTTSRAAYYTSLAPRPSVHADASKSSHAIKDNIWERGDMRLQYSCLCSSCHGMTLPDWQWQACNVRKAFTVKKLCHDPYMHYQPMIKRRE